METQTPTSQTQHTPYPDIPPVIRSLDSEYVDKGITSTVNIAGHPLHPVIVIFPVAFLVGAWLADIGYWLTSDPFWARGAIWLLLGGLITGLVAGIIGMFDFTRIKRARKHSAGWAHMYGNIIAIVLTAINLGLRWGDMTEAVIPTGLILSTLVAVLLGVSGWFGGELTFRHKIGVIGPSSQES
ncbi:DUF2231 domain-containing protein [Desertifilum sp. FACHB-1129]|uniref:DUF2231 domain-containing protein n=1 Tax=Desertifilum tharense IPPAS B-1220 TaxID=1781255 RepID=A0A1E5QPD3_9CYAN|nr:MULTISPECIES: DUF2231 domain-containing protein [Desertifilum]MDA0211031.1 DUF2231 domain-containing protein [Cyanobacteria bacterium FC1]MBD2312715.1 DUF2231 domain-containing protein [Desertifilum sp. FACHB-1129]MBD2320196.1 DUF2231 domain-containing protein [Desertifilum sp. FACHB-866]MBD2330324.1 DUF2231 domain-containing protein [Desertifilum sp. FACHB-868]OEJ76509.1 hypothetical protein BH720_03955 [Desertifilum tharense IPPAS B-1220]